MRARGERIFVSLGDSKRIDLSLSVIAGTVVIAVSVYLLTLYLNVQAAMAFRIVLFVAAEFAWVKVLGCRIPSRRELIVFGLFSLLFDASLVLGYHIEVGDGNPYFALKDTAFITDYHLIDIVFFIGMYPVILLLCILLFRLPRFVKEKTKLTEDSFRGRVAIRFGLVFAIALFAAWTPYLIAYYPGFVFGDTLSSLAQATGSAPWNNHHPVLYTAFIAACLNIAEFFGLGVAAGCALSCLIQMAFLAGCFSYLVSWVVSLVPGSKPARFFVAALLFVFFGLTPYIATYSIAMWKDPIFSASIIVLTLFTADVLIRRRAITVKRLIVFALFALIASFSRNNGVYVVCAVTAVLVFLAFFGARRNMSTMEPGGSRSGSRIRKLNTGISVASLVAVGVFVMVVYGVVTGPVYGLLGIASSPRVESLGIPLNQMARVAAYDGDMTESDRDYLDAALPIEEYADHYYPCCTDNLKWDADFDSSVLEEGFLGHWLSMLVRNPVLYFEAWELQTFGFWVVNQSVLWAYTGNIAGGAPRTVFAEYGSNLEAYGIDPGVANQHYQLRVLFPYEDTSIPVGVIFWMLLYLACCFVVARRYLWIVTLVPSFALIATLLVASPIWYWPRYGAALQFLLPFYLALFVMSDASCADVGQKPGDVEAWE